MSTPFVKWSLIKLTKDLGVLGVGNIMQKNLTLLFKWRWRFSVANCSYGNESYYMSTESRV